MLAAEPARSRRQVAAAERRRRPRRDAARGGGGCAAAAGEPAAAPQPRRSRAGGGGDGDRCAATRSRCCRRRAIRRTAAGDAGQHLLRRGGRVTLAGRRHRGLGAARLCRRPLRRGGAGRRRRALEHAISATSPTGLYRLRIDQIAGGRRGGEPGRDAVPARLSARAAAAAGRAGGRRPSAAAGRSVTVQPGNNLWTLARAHYGSGVHVHPDLHRQPRADPRPGPDLSRADLRACRSADAAD